MCFARESRLIVRPASAGRRAAGRTPLKGSVWGNNIASGTTQLGSAGNRL